MIDGRAVASCSASYPDIHFMIDGYWLQVQPEDYLRELNANDGACELKIKPIDAPFNVMGMPAFIGYYVTHSWGADQAAYMAWSPHPDSTKVPLQPGAVPTQEFRITYASEDVENGRFWAITIASIFCLLALVAWYYVIQFLRDSEDGPITSDAQA